jgi:SET domain-containing protein
MLLVKTELRESQIQGLGVFSAEPIPAGAVVWEFTPGLDQAFSPEILKTLNAAQCEQFLRHSYMDSRTQEYICCADDGRYMNHCDSPNTVEFYAGPQDRYGANVAAYDIPEGEELTCDYFSFDLEATEKLDFSSTTNGSKYRGPFPLLSTT